jgi:hypothetical protein
LAEAFDHDLLRHLSHGARQREIPWRRRRRESATE